MKDLFSTLAAQLDRGAVLCTIAASRGSTPRGAGARMLVTAAGRAAGTVGGGEVERRAEALALSMLAEKRSCFETYRLSAGEIADIGMICGGDVEIFFQYFDPADRDAREAAARILDLLDRPGPSWLVTAAEGSGWRMGTYDRQNGLRGLELPPETLEGLLAGRVPCTSSAQAMSPGRWPGFWPWRSSGWRSMTSGPGQWTGNISPMRRRGSPAPSRRPWPGWTPSQRRTTWSS